MCGLHGARSCSHRTSCYPLCCSSSLTAGRSVRPSQRSCIGWKISALRWLNGDIALPSTGNFIMAYWEEYKHGLLGRGRPTEGYVAVYCSILCLSHCGVKVCAQCDCCCCRFPRASCRMCGARSMRRTSSDWLTQGHDNAVVSVLLDWSRDV